MPRVKKPKELKIDLSPYSDPPEGFIKGHIDKLKPNSVDEVYYNFGFHKIPGRQRCAFMEKLYEVMKEGAKAVIIVPYYTHMKAVIDQESEWPPLCEGSFYYFDNNWRATQKLPAIKCNFQWGYGHNDDPSIVGRSREVRDEWLKYRMNVVQDLQVVLTKK